MQYAVERHGHDESFVSDLLAIAEDAFTQHRAELMKLFDQKFFTTVRMHGGKEICNEIKRKLAEIMAKHEYEIFLNSGGNC